MLGEDLRGTFVLTPSVSGGTYFEYDISDVNWYLNRGGEESHITGSGTYTRISGFAGWWHQLELDLSIDGADPVHFDSGGENGGEKFPDLTGLTISR